MSGASNLRIPKIDDVGIGKINDLTKEELIWCVGYLVRCHGPNGQHWLNSSILEIANQRREKTINIAAERHDKWMELLKEYNELLAPYDGVKIGDLPPDVIDKGAELEKAMQEARNKYFVAMKWGG